MPFLVQGRTMATETVHTRPQLRSDLVIEIQGEGETVRYLIIDPLSNRYFQCGHAQYLLLRLFTGELTHAEIIKRYGEQTHIRLRPEQLEAALNKLETLKFLLSNDAFSTRSESTPPAATQQGRLSWRFTRRWRLFPAQRILLPLETTTRWLFTAPFLACCSLLILTSWWIITHGGWSQGIAPVLIGLYNRPSLVTWGIFLLAILITAFVHECAHALTLQHFGRKPGHFGVGVAFPVGIFFYAEIGEVWRLTKRRQRVSVSLAGPLASLLVGAVGALLWWTFPFQVTWSPWLAILMTAGTTTGLLNLIPFVRTDGYFALADWVGIPNLGRQSRTYILQTLLRPFRTQHRPALKLAPARHLLFAGYGVIALLLTLWLVWAVSGFVLRAVVPLVVLIRHLLGV
jgi:putative peptide zinc metalloprotease protein